MKKYFILILLIIFAAVGIVSLYLSTQSNAPVTQTSSDVLTTKKTKLQHKQITSTKYVSDESLQPEPTKEELKEAESKLETGSSQIASGSSESKAPLVTLPPVKQKQLKKTTPKPKVTEPAVPEETEDVSGTVILFLEDFDEEGLIYSNPETGNGQYFYYDQVVSHHIVNINIGSEISVTYDYDGDVVKVKGKKVVNSTE